MLNNYNIDYNRYADSDVFGADLPAVYISNIDVSENSRSSTFKIKLCIFEKSNPDGTFLWYQNDLVRGYLNIRVKFNDEDPFATIDIAKQEDISQYEYETRSDGSTIYKIMYETETTIDSPLSSLPNVKFSAYVEIDILDIYADYGIFMNFEGMTESEVEKAIQKLTLGPIDSTTAFNSGRLITTKELWFTTPAGELWLGSRHRSKGKIMAGSKHTTSSHPLLRSSREPNGVYFATSKEILETIIDFSLDEQLANLLNIDQQSIRSGYSDLITNEAYISNIFLSRASTSGPDKNDIITSFFSIDLSKFMVQNSRYGYVYGYLSEARKMQLLQSVEIINFRVFRNRNDIENAVPVLIANTRDNSPSNLLNKPGLIEQNLYGNNGIIRTFQINDESALSLQGGEYSYEISVSLIDPIYDFFTQMYQGMSLLMADLERFLQKVEIDYNYTFNTLSTAVSDEISNMPYSQSPAGIAQTFLNTFLNTFNFPDADSYILGALSDNISLYLSPRTATLESIRQSIEIFQVLTSNLQGFVNTKDYDAINNSDVKGSSEEASNYLEIRYEFDNFDISDYKSYIKFIDIDRGSGPLSSLVLNSTVLQRKYNEDVSVYLSSTSGMGGTATNAKLTFFSVQNININGSTYNTNQWADQIYSELLAFNNFGQSDTMRSLESGFTGLEAAELFIQNGIMIETESLPSTSPASEIIGLASKFLQTTDSDLDLYSSLSLSDEAAAIYKNLATRLPLDEDEMTFDYNSLVASVSGRNSVQSKSLISAAGEAGFGAASSDNYNRSSLGYEILANPRTNLDSQINKLLIYLKYGTMGKVEYLSSDNGGVGDVQWTKLNASSSPFAAVVGSRFLCRISRIISYGYPNKSGDVFNLSTKNQYFILQIAE